MFGMTPRFLEAPHPATALGEMQFLYPPVGELRDYSQAFLATDAGRGCGRDLERWLEPPLDEQGNKTRHQICLGYFAGTIDLGYWKSTQLIAALIDPPNY